MENLDSSSTLVAKIIIIIIIIKNFVENIVLKVKICFVWALRL